MAAAGVYLSGLRSAATPSRNEPGPTDGTPRCSLKTAPPERDAVDAGFPSASVKPSNDSPPEWATMNQGGTPDATSAPITEPAEVPTMWSAAPGSHPVSSARPARRPVTQAHPRTPPAPNTRPTFI